MKGLEAPVRTVRSPGGFFGGEKTDVMCSKRIVSGTSLVVQWLKDPPASSGGIGLIPDLGRFHTLRGN